MQNWVLAQKDPQGIGTITLNKPERHNVFDEKIIKMLNQTVLEFENDPTIRVIILAANGKNFSAGADLDWMKRMVNFSQQENVQDAMQLVELLRTLSHLSKPTIALANGMTVGGGIGLLACCDIVIAQHTASFCFAEAKIGLVPATVAPYVISAIGKRMAQYYFLTAKTFNAQEAKEMGLVQELCEEDALHAEGVKLAHTLLHNGPTALKEIKKLLLRFNGFSQDLLQETAQLIANVRVSEEAQEGLSAFFEKRKPKWYADDWEYQ